MSVCKNCGKPVTAGDKFCSYCGLPVSLPDSPQENSITNGGKTTSGVPQPPGNYTPFNYKQAAPPTPVQPPASPPPSGYQNYGYQARPPLTSGNYPLNNTGYYPPPPAPAKAKLGWLYFLVLILVVGTGFWLYPMVKPLLPGGSPPPVVTPAPPAFPDLPPKTTEQQSGPLVAEFKAADVQIRQRDLLPVGGDDKFAHYLLLPGIKKIQNGSTVLAYMFSVNKQKQTLALTQLHVPADKLSALMVFSIVQFKDGREDVLRSQETISFQPDSYLAKFRQEAFNRAK